MSDYHPHRRTHGEQRKYLLPHMVERKDLLCPECGKVDWFLADEYGKGKHPVIAYCSGCNTMTRMKIAQWAAYEDRFND